MVWFKINEDEKLDIRVLLGIVNSRLISWFAELTLSNFGKNIFPKLNPQDVKSLPIVSNGINKPYRDTMQCLVDDMLKAKGQLAEAKTDKDKTYYEIKCQSLDCQIDGLVYKLYGLTDEEIGIVEENTKSNA